MKKHIQDKRNELIWALHKQDYTDTQIGEVFNLHRSTIARIIQTMPNNWEPKWVKVY